MSQLQPMPTISIPPADLAVWGRTWLGTSRASGQLGKKPERFDKKQGMDFGTTFDQAVGQALAEMLGGIPVVTPKATALTPPEPDCVEVGPTRVIGGIRPQNYDVAYRPDGPRIVFDSKTLNDKSSIRKNWQNMVNDLATEAATVHTRFPFCVVAFMVILPKPALPLTQHRAIAATLERLGSRKDELDQHHLAEAIALVLWEPQTGMVQPPSAAPGSLITLAAFSARIEAAYIDRYQHLPPHSGT